VYEIGEYEKENGTDLVLVVVVVRLAATGCVVAVETGLACSAVFDDSATKVGEVEDGRWLCGLENVGGLKGVRARVRGVTMNGGRDGDCLEVVTGRRR
jgi:hypothetical protein